MVVPYGKPLRLRLRHSPTPAQRLQVCGDWGKEALFIPCGDMVQDLGRLLVCEGPTDTAALLDMGLENVVGRPSCAGGVKLVVELVKRRRAREVVIVADADKPGRIGAGNLATVLLAYARSVHLVVPPCGIKDVRDWLRAGGTRGDVEQTIDATPARRLTIITRTV
jgi:DNA primase